MGDFTRASATIAVSILLLLIIGWALLRRLPSGEGRLNRLGVFLSRDTGRDVGYASALRRVELVGREGVAATDLRPSGTGIFDGERIDVVSDAGWIEQDEPIRIIASEGYRHVVRPLAHAEEATEEAMNDPTEDV